VNRTLAITAVTASGRAYDIDFPLHPETRAAEGVEALVTDLLGALSRTLAERHDVSDGDVLQALSMTLAVRARMLGASPESTSELVHGLFETAYSAARAAQPYASGRA
jgi:hypothetical protein